MSELLDENIRKQVEEIFNQLKEPVHILFFGSNEDCEYCQETRQLVEEVASLSDKVSLEVHDLQADAALAVQYHVDRTPGLIIAAKDGDQVSDYGIRLSGIPSGHEFNSLIQDILLVSGRDSGLSEKTRNYLKTLTSPIQLQVFVTPTCPYCPRAVVLAHMLAMESPLVRAEMVEAMEFPELSQRHNVSGVPQTTVNDGATQLVGAVPEDNLVAAIQEAMQVPAA